MGPNRQPLRGAIALALVLTSGCGTRVRDQLRALSTPGATSTTAAATTAPPTTAPATTTGPIDAAAARAEITANWEKFFRATSTIAEREALLENGSQYVAALTQRSTDPLQAQASAKVTAVQVSGPDRAAVTYDVSLNGNVALPGAQGVAVLQDGVWKVGAQSFCSLVSLGATGPIPGC